MIRNFEKNRNLKLVLKKVKNIALIGASSNQKRDSYKVMNFLINNGYKVFPVNPNEINNTILGEKCYSRLCEIKDSIDMVDIFRSSEYVYDITKEAIVLNVNVIWTQEGIFDENAAQIAKNAGILFITNECPKKVLEN